MSRPREKSRRPRAGERSEGSQANQAWQVGIMTSSPWPIKHGSLVQCSSRYTPWGSDSLGACRPDTVTMREHECCRVVESRDCVCTLSPDWSPSSVVRMHPGSNPTSPPQLSSSASPPQLSSNASRHVPIGIESLIIVIRTTDSDPTGAPTEHPRRFCVSAPLSWSY